MDKLKVISSTNYWNRFSSWEESEKKWEEGATVAAGCQPIKDLKRLPSMVGIAEKGLRWKALKWLVLKDHKREILRRFLRHPLRYSWRYLVSLVRGPTYLREGDFFLYGVKSLTDFEALLCAPNTLFVVGFSYCHKPFECPSGRFSADCIADAEHPVCRQCFIGKAIHALPSERVMTLAIPTVHYIGVQLFDIVHAHPDKRVIFLITACEMSLTMFGDWGAVIGVEGIGVRLGGRICNTMRAFALAEEGIKPGLTVVLPETQQQILDLIRRRRMCKS